MIEAIRSHGRVWKYKVNACRYKKMADAQWSATIVDRAISSSFDKKFILNLLLIYCDPQYKYYRQTSKISSNVNIGPYSIIG